MTETSGQRDTGIHALCTSGPHATSMLRRSDRGDRRQAGYEQKGAPVEEIPSYDLAISLPEDRQSGTHELEDASRQRGLTVLHDPERTHEWWARKSAGDLPDVHVRFFVPVISALDDFTTAMLRAVATGDRHVLPVLADDVVVPPELLHPHVSYRRDGDHLIEELAGRVERAETAGWERGRLADVVTRAREIEPPAAVPVTFSRYVEQDAALRYLGEQFAAAIPRLRGRGFTGTTHHGDERIALRIERAGDIVYALDVQRGGIGGDETLNFVVGLHDTASACTNGWARPIYDTETGTAKLELHDHSVFGRDRTEPRTLTREELFTALWQRIDSVLTATAG